MYITHEMYDKNASRALEKVGSFVASAFYSGLWSVTSPILVEHKDPSRFKTLTDSHHEGRSRLLSERLLKGELDSLEQESLHHVLSTYRKFCEHFNLAFDLRSSSIYSALYQSRLIRELHSKDLSGKVVYEIGPGSGFLSILLTTMGAKVFAIEAVQSHYVYQSYLFDFFFKENFYEHAFSNSLEGVEDVVGLNHLPWWKICHPLAELTPADILTSNHMLMETSPAACNFYRHLAKKIMTNAGSWVIEGFGAHYPGGPKQEEFIRDTKNLGFNFYNLTRFYSHYGVYLFTKDERTSISLIKTSSSLGEFLAKLERDLPSISDNSFLSNSDWMSFLSLDPNQGSLVNKTIT